jgi:hypothetical protein
MKGDATMKRSLGALAITVAILWGGAVLGCGMMDQIWPSDGVAFLQVVSSSYPGYHATSSLGSVVIGMISAILDGAVCGLLFGWFSNCFAPA